LRLPKFEYVEPKSLKEAVKAFAEDGESVLLAGGSDLVVGLKQRLFTPQRMINLKAIPDLAYVSKDQEGLRIGALATLHDLATTPLIREKYPALSYAAGEAGAFVHQVMGTLGGNLCQGNRCRYYNQSLFWRNAKTPCYKASGEMCYVVGKPEVCYATYSGDLAPVLIALGSRIKVVGQNGEQTLPLLELYTQDGKDPLSLSKGEIIEEVLVPPPSGKTLYLKLRVRESIDFPVISLAMFLEKDPSGQVRKTRIVFSAVGCGPVETPEAEKMLEGEALSDPLIKKVSNAVLKEISPLRTTFTSPAYKRRMARALVQQALEEMRVS
jgi:4-hydroxybenzoyl-CoA reductase subunit beta